MSEKKIVRKSVAMALGILCIILIASLIGTIAIYTSMIDDKSNTITSLNSQIAAQNGQISYLNSTVWSLRDNVSILTNIVNLDVSQNWLNEENVSLGAGGSVNWTFYPYSSGVIRVYLLTTSSDPWVNIKWYQNIDAHITIKYNIIYNQLATPSNGYLLRIGNAPEGTWAADFPVVAYPPSSTKVEITVGNNSTIEALATVTIGDIY